MASRIGKLDFTIVLIPRYSVNCGLNFMISNRVINKVVLSLLLTALSRPMNHAGLGV